MRKTRHSKRRIIQCSCIALLVVIFFSAALLVLKIWEKSQGKFPETGYSNPVIEYNGEEYVINENVETLLILGLDKYESDEVVDSYINDQQADFLLLLVFDNDSKKMSAIQINRDTMADVNILGVAGNKVNTVKKQIALAHTYGNGRDVSCRNTADAVSSLLMGAKVDHYASLKMDAISFYNDLVGGVEVTVLHDFTGVDNTLVKGEKVILRGEQALTYVRARQGIEDSSNSTRMERQRQYLSALYDKSIQCAKDDDSFIIDASVKMSDLIISDRSVTQIQEIARKIADYEFSGIISLEGESKVGEEFMEFYPDEGFIKETVIELFYTPKK